MDYREILDYVYSFIDFEKIPRYSYASSFRLERMHAFLRVLGNPHLGLNTIHIAGSKGKGSTCAIIASVLKEAGHRVGLYTSPHLLDVKERIRVLDLCAPEDFIKEKEFIAITERIKPVAEKFRDHKELGKLSFFEFLTACAFLYFKEKKVDYAVLETGLGGRLDATNVTNPLVCGITNISMEHTDKLGNSLEEIAGEKAGIVKGKGVVVSAIQKKKVLRIIEQTCRKKKAKLYEVGKDITYSVIESTQDGQVFNLNGPDYSYKNLEINLIGAHQVENAALAIGMLKAMDDINDESIRKGLKNISWPGRLQIVQREPYIILDGAQNIASVRAALKSIKKIFRYKRLITVFGISSDKDIKGVSEELNKSSELVILTKSSNVRAEDPMCMKKYFSKHRTTITNNTEEALEQGLKAADKEDLILVIGSLYVVAEAMKFTQPLNLAAVS